MMPAARQLAERFECVDERAKCNGERNAAEEKQARPRAKEGKEGRKGMVS